MPDKGPPILIDLRERLLVLHKALLDRERGAYQKEHGAVSAGQLLQLVISDQQFAWLHAISETIVRIDEMLDEPESIAPQQVTELVGEVRKLLMPSETGTDFQRKYDAAIHSDADIVVEHAEVMKLLGQKSAASQ